MTDKKTEATTFNKKDDRLISSDDIDKFILQLDDKQRENFLWIEEGLQNQWRAGRHVMLSWCPSEKGIDVLYVPYYFINDLAFNDTGSKLDIEDDNSINDTHSLFIYLTKGTRYLDPELMDEIQENNNVYRITIKLPNNFSEYPVATALVDNVIKRYSISYIEDRAVTLFDIDRFTRYPAFDQVTLLNSLAYSINSAHEKMLRRNIRMDFARSTTGDGFYVWNRESGLNANINLYHLMHIILADNAIARMKSDSALIPSIKTAFHIGDCYEFYQTEGLSQTSYSYIVGDVTIELARLIEHARAGQILVGDFQTDISVEDSQDPMHLDSVSFIESIQPTLDKLKGVELSGARIESIKCYFTGRKQPDDTFDINMLRLVDKHEMKHFAYNAKINIYPELARPIFLGIQEKDLSVG